MSKFHSNIHISTSDSSIILVVAKVGWPVGRGGPQVRSADAGLGLAAVSTLEAVPAVLHLPLLLQAVLAHLLAPGAVLGPVAGVQKLSPRQGSNA